MSVPRLRSPLGLGRATVVLLGLVALADLLAIGAGFGVYGVADDLARGSGAFGAALTGRAHDSDALYTASGVAQTPVGLVCSVVVLVWLYRVRVNAEVVRPDGHSKARAWVIAGWVVPLANFWYPRRVVLDVWDASDPSGARPRHALINFWWALWLVSSQVGWIMQRAYGAAHTAADFREAALEVMISDAVDVVAAGLAALVVLRLSRMQLQKALAGPILVPALG